MPKYHVKYILAALLYFGLAIHLYYPYFSGFDKLQPRDLFIPTYCSAAIGAFVLSRRWVSAFAGSAFAGVLYGFGPVLLGLARHHPAAAVIAAAVPWLFCPSAFWARGKSKWLTRLLTVLPFLAVVLFFISSAHLRLFAMPIQTKLQLSDLIGLLTCLVPAKHNTTIVGLYHVPVCALLTGIFMLVAARRFSIALIFILGTILAFCKPILGISPLIWLAFPALCCAIVTGEGIQGLILASTADKKTLAVVAVIMLVLAIAALLLATRYYQVLAGLGQGYGRLLRQAAQMYILGAAVIGIILFMARAKLRLQTVRTLILSIALIIDIFLGAVFVVDKIF